MGEEDPNLTDDEREILRLVRLHAHDQPASCGHVTEADILAHYRKAKTHVRSRTKMDTGSECRDRWHTVAGGVDRASHCPGCGMSRVGWGLGAVRMTRGQYEDAIVEAYDRGYVDGMKPGAVAPSATIDSVQHLLEVPEDLG